MVCSLPEVEVKVEREAGGAAGGGGRRSPFLCTERTKMGFENSVLQSAERYGFKAIILIVDTPRLGRREAEIKNRMIAPQMKLFEGLLSTEGASVSRALLLPPYAFKYDHEQCIQFVLYSTLMMHISDWTEQKHYSIVLMVDKTEMVVLYSCSSWLYGCFSHRYYKVLFEICCHFFLD
ncbi:hypothetical protein Vadar_024538 [Vaccinium darrowii]|uniref:Uncharacterized protein n=1 Tax=Vaccinium darrowii TaxID=229202 RepID=A0ACB7ZMC9_9ERIC|nr:hypothetical protein Vadar_024538 [Vaccinium darrowii]